VEKMQPFEKWGLKDNPYTTEPIGEDTLSLFVGRKDLIKKCCTALSTKSVIIVEGDRGVGTTSFGNYVRFKQKEQKINYTPKREFSVHPGWNSEILIANVISSVVRGLEQDFKKLNKNKNFKKIKRATHEVRETYRKIAAQLSVGGTGVGIKYGKETVISTPPIYPEATLIQYLEELKPFLEEKGYEKQSIIQINNLDLTTVMPPAQMRFFLNNIRDTLQIPGYNWVLVGDTGLCSFIRTHVDRVSDIVSIEVKTPSLKPAEIFEVIERRVELNALHEKAYQPVSSKVIETLYNATQGRIRHIFRLASELVYATADNELIDEINMDVAKPVLKTFVEERAAQYSVWESALNILKQVVTHQPITTNALAKKLGTPQPNVSRALSSLQKARLAYCKIEGKKHLWMAEPDVTITYSEEKNR